MAVGTGVNVGDDVTVGLGVFVSVFVGDDASAIGVPVNSNGASIASEFAIWAEFVQAEIEKIKIISINGKVMLIFCLVIVLLFCIFLV